MLRDSSANDYDRAIISGHYIFQILNLLKLKMSYQKF